MKNENRTLILCCLQVACRFTTNTTCLCIEFNEKRSVIFILKVGHFCVLWQPYIVLYSSNAPWNHRYSLTPPNEKYYTNTIIPCVELWSVEFLKNFCFIYLTFDLDNIYIYVIINCRVAGMTITNNKWFFFYVLIYTEDWEKVRVKPFVDLSYWKTTGVQGEKIAIRRLV